MIDLNTPGDFDHRHNLDNVNTLVEAIRDANALRARILQRTSEGRYVISERELVLAIRAFHKQGNTAGKMLIGELLLSRCNLAFQRYSYGLRHRPELREEVIASMGEHLLREALDPNEMFPVQNFIHYLQCLCIDEFNRVLRQEGLAYKRGEDGRPSGRPQHVPRALIEPIRPVSPDDDSLSTADVADPQDQYEQLHADEESLRILTYLNDALDRKIMVLRAIYSLKWDDIAVICNRTERTVRLRFERSRKHLQECLAREGAGYLPALAPSTGKRRNL